MAEYIETVYDTKVLKRVYISGDGQSESGQGRIYEASMESIRNGYRRSL